MGEIDIPKSYNYRSLIKAMDPDKKIYKSKRNSPSINACIKYSSNLIKRLFSIIIGMYLFFIGGGAINDRFIKIDHFLLY